MEVEARKVVLERILDLNIDWIRAVDSKISPFLAIDLALFGVLATLAKATPSWSILTALLSLSAALLLAASVLFLALAAFPRTKASHRSLIYFGEIARLRADEYARAINSLEEADYLSDLASQCHINAEIASRKHEFLRYAAVSLFGSILPWLAGIFTLYRT